MIGCMRGNCLSVPWDIYVRSKPVADITMASAAVTAVVCIMVAARPLKLYGRDGESDGHSHRSNILAHRGIVPRIRRGMRREASNTS